MSDFTFLQGHDRRKSCGWLEHPVLDVNTVMQAQLSSPVLEKQSALSIYFSSQPPWWPVIMTTRAFYADPCRGTRWQVLWVRFSDLDRHQRRDRKSQGGTNSPGRHVCLSASQGLGHFLLTSPPLVTAGLPARDIPWLGFLPFCLELVDKIRVLHSVYLTCCIHQRNSVAAFSWTAEVGGMWKKNNKKNPHQMASYSLSGVIQFSWSPDIPNWSEIHNISKLWIFNIVATKLNMLVPSPLKWVHELNHEM